MEPSASVILQALKDNSKLTFINLNDNSMTGQAAEHLAYTYYTCNFLNNDKELVTILH